MKNIRWILAAVLSGAFSVFAQTASPAPRTWVDQQGRSITATLIGVDADNVVLKMESGAMATVPIARFSKSDQAFVNDWSRKSGVLDPTLASKPLIWPQSITVNAKDLQIENGEQNPAERRFVYQSGSFQFVSNAALTGTVVREIAGDFELTKALLAQLPWGWQPKPRNGGKLYLANLYETEKDFFAGGGSENSSGGSTNDYIFTKFSTLGLKKVGDRFAFDAKLKKDGEMIALISRLVMGDMRSYTVPWSGMGFESFLEHAAYRNGTFALANPEKNIKAHIEERRNSNYSGEKLTTDVDRMVTFAKSSWADQSDNAVLLRAQRYLDGMLLVYFFGYLDDDGKGTRLHRYFRAVAQEALTRRAYNESGRKGTPPPAGTYAERSAALSKIVLADRTDGQLREQIIAKFKSVGIKL
jgi:hypothetical protein